MGHHDACWSARFWQSLVRKIGLGGIVPYLRFLSNHLSGLILWPFEPLGPPPTVLVAAASSLQCWPAGKALLGLARLRVRSRIDTTMVKRESRRWGPGVAKRGLLPRLGPKDWDLQYLLLLVRSANDGESGNSHFEESLPRPDFFGRNETRYQPQH